jgi:hypothetical protein
MMYEKTVLGLFDAFNATSILSKVDEESVTDGVANTLAFTKTKVGLFPPRLFFTLCFFVRMQVRQVRGK